MRALAVLPLFLCFGLASARAQSAAPLPDAPAASSSMPETQALAVPALAVSPTYAKSADRVCPGEFPTNLLVLDCSFTPQKRLDNFLVSSVTDQAVLSSVVGALSSQIVRSPAEWPETWHYYGYRLAASYAGGLARGTVEYTIGTIAHSDPRHVSCSEDPLLAKAVSQDLRKATHCQGTRGQLLDRPLHVFTDAFTVRHSDPAGTGFRYPALERVAGVYAASYASYPWQPGVENTFPAVSRRAGLAYLFTFVGSVWHEYGPSITSRFQHTQTLEVR
jgi:hypothetical protein